MNTLQICPLYLGKSKKVIFQHYYLYSSDYFRYLRRKQIAVYVLLFSASYYLHSPSTASGACYTRSTCGHVEACCDMSWISALCECTMQLNNVEKDWKHVLTQKFVNLNTYCDITCRTFQLPHITISSFQSHWWQPTTGSLQSHKRLKERNNLQSDKKVVQFTS